MANLEHLLSPFTPSAVERLADDETLQQFFIELQDILITESDFLLTDRTIAARIAPVDLEEPVEIREARVHILTSQLVKKGLLHVARSKTNVVGDYLPTYVVTGLPSQESR